MKDQGAYFNTLARRLTSGLRIDKSRMWNTACAPVQLRIKALDQGNFLGRLTICKVPFMLFVRPDRVRFATPIGIYEPDAHQVRVGDAPRVGDRERIFEDRLDGAPYVDDLIPRREELRGLIRQVVRHARLGGAVRLVDVNAVHRAADSTAAGASVGGRAPDRVVEDEDARCAGSRRSASPCCSRKRLRILQ